MNIITLNVRRTFKYWEQDRRLHRESGPAVICDLGRKEWWERGNFIRSNSAIFKRYNEIKLKEEYYHEITIC